MQSWLSRTTVPSIALVASRDVEDQEELFLDYRLNPEMPLPDWYHIVDKDESTRRWT